MNVPEEIDAVGLESRANEIQWAIFRYANSVGKLDGMDPVAIVIFFNLNRGPAIDIAVAEVRGESLDAAFARRMGLADHELDGILMLAGPRSNQPSSSSSSA